MKNKMSILVYFFICAAVIGGAIYASRRNHDHCGECKLAISLSESNGKFVSK